jgi:hypothetical protein
VFFYSLVHQGLGKIFIWPWIPEIQQLICTLYVLATHSYQLWTGRNMELAPEVAGIILFQGPFLIFLLCPASIPGKAEKQTSGLQES